MVLQLSPSHIPTITAGNLFARLTQDETLNVRWVTPADPVLYSVYNRVYADIVVRQLAIAKAVDSVGVSLSHLTTFPFVIPALVGDGTSIVNVPQAWIWDMQASVPATWENLRLAKIVRVSGENTETTDSISYTGKLRLIFSANKRGFTAEHSLFYVDYTINSPLTYQLCRIALATSDIDADAVTTAETDSSTISGFVEFKTLDQSVGENQTFLNLLAPPSVLTDEDDNGEYDSPAIYEVIDSDAGGPTASDDFALSALNHGTGLLTYSAWNSIPSAYNDIQSWIESVNYPYDDDANRLSTTSVRIPNGLFREFNIAAPAGDQYTGDTSGLTYPVYVSRIEAVGTTEETIRYYFATFGVDDSDPSVAPIEFATLDLSKGMIAGEVVSIIPLTDLFGVNNELFQQGFGRGHVVLSNKWSDDIAEINDFFDSFSTLIASPRDISFPQANTRVSAFGVSRVPKYIPTKGQSQALAGTTSKLSDPIAPSESNLFVTEQDQGLGNQIDLEAVPGITPTSAIQRYGYSGSLCHRVIKMIVVASESDDQTDDFYDVHVLPRLTELLGRAPIFGDVWYDGLAFKTYNGDTWQT